MELFSADKTKRVQKTRFQKPLFDFSIKQLEIQFSRIYIVHDPSHFFSSILCCITYKKLNNLIEPYFIFVI